MQNCKLALPEAARQLFEQVVTGAEYIIERADADVLRAASDEPVGERRRPCRAANERQGAAVADAERRARGEGFGRLGGDAARIGDERADLARRARLFLRRDAPQNEPGERASSAGS